MAPLFSIITVTRDAASTLRPTLDSIKAQTCTLYEVILQDGASTDDTVALAHASGVPNLKLVSAPDKGIYDAMNRALARATGDYVVFLNAGDSLHSPHTLQLLADTVMDHDYPGVVYGRTLIVQGPERTPLGARRLDPPASLDHCSFRDGMLVCHQAFVVLRKLTSPFDTRYRFSADFDWCIRCLQRSRRNHYVDAVIADYLSEGMTTRNRRRSLQERYRIMCHYYGTLPTLWRHLGFALRGLRARGRDYK